MEADSLSVDIMVKAGYNPNGLVSILNKLESNKADVIHGDPKKRADKVKRKIKNYNGKIPQLDTNRANRFKRLLVFRLENRIIKDSYYFLLNLYQL